MAKKRAEPPAQERYGARERYGVEAELDRLLACPECGSSRVRANKNATGGYGFFGFKAIGDLTAPRQVICRNCAAEWLRPPLRELRAEAQRRIDERYDRFTIENQRLLEELERDRRTNFAPPEPQPDPGPAAETAAPTASKGPYIDPIDFTPDAGPGEGPAN